MKQVKTFFFAALLSLCGFGMLTSCSNEDNEIDSKPLAEQILGEWMTVEYDGEPVFTDERVFFDFVSPNKCIMTLLLDDSEDEGGWLNDVEYDMKIDGNDITLTGQLTDKISVVYELEIHSIVGNDMWFNLVITVNEEGEDGYQDIFEVHSIRTTSDNRAAIIGTWEGTYWDDANTKCRFEFKDDETYNFYYFDEESGEWILSEDEYTYYTCEGDVLFMRWQNTGKSPICECWDIRSIKDGVMKWHALRYDEDGNTYVIDTEFTKQ